MTERVLVFGHRARRGGVPVHLAHLARALPGVGIEPVFALPDGVTWKDEIARTGASIVAFEQRGKGDLLAAARAAKVIRSVGARLVATHARPLDLWAGLGARLAGVPLVATLHAEPARSPAGSTRTDPRARAHGAVLRHLAARVIVVAEPFRELARTRLGVPPAKLTVVENGVDVAALAPTAERRRAARALLRIPEDETALGYVARFVDHGSEEKGQPDLVRALAHVRARVVVHFMGDGPTREAVERLARASSGHVRFHGERPSEEVVHAFSALVLASRSEGCPYAALEAMAAGVPVVATRTGALPGLLEEGRAGVLVPVSDPAALARGIDECLARRDELARAALERVARRNSLERFARETAAVYRAAIAAS